MAPTTATALVTRAGKLRKENVPVPIPDEHQVLVKVSHVAQNPTDGKSCSQALTRANSSVTIEAEALSSPIARLQCLW